MYSQSGSIHTTPEETKDERFRAPQISYLTSEFMTVVNVKIIVLRDITPGGPLDGYKRFAGTCRPHL